VGWWLGGLAAERLPRHAFIIVSWLILVPLLLLIGSTSGALLIVVTFMFMVLSFAQAPSIVTMVADYAPPGHLGASFGMMFFLAFGLGSFAATLAGFTAEQWGTDAVFTILAGVNAMGALLAALLLLLTRWRKPEPRMNPA
jgi:predicted MFS family arabinose efflux permease